MTMIEKRADRLILGVTAMMVAIACVMIWMRAHEPPRPFSAAAVVNAINDPGRALHRAADARRKPVELITLAGLKPGDKVLDLIPGDGYWTRIFSKIVGPTGRVYAVWPQVYAKYAMGNVKTLQELAANEYYGNIITQVQPTINLKAPEKLDMVWTSQNYHDYPDEYMGGADPMLLSKAAFALLKPGGVFIVIDHAAASGSGLRDTEDLHRIDPAIVKEQAKAAGFEFAGESDVLLNPKDPLDIPVFNPAIRKHTSQFAYKFRKPE